MSVRPSSRDLDPSVQDMEAVGESVYAPRSVPATWWAIKRSGDIVVGLALALFTLPIVAVAALGVFVTTGGLPFYVQERVGQHGRIFKMFKLRTMVKDAHAMRDDLMHLNEVDGPVFKIRNDPRLHSLGGLLRRTSIDELPNFWNVVLGHISIVGPRPALPNEVAHYDRRALRRLEVPQGITCLWQIHGRSEVSFERWMEFDSEYARTWSPLGDVWILLRTIPAVLRRDGAH
jgi:lipopolysaccharide/colanic/teichoic acid biosynthesis glycosyltransferase